MHRHLIPLLLAGLVMTAGACGDDDSALVEPSASQPAPVDDTTAPTPTDPATTPGSVAPTAPTAPGATPAPTGNASVVAAVADLAARKDVEPDAITVVTSRAVTWPNTGLGCPRKGMMYLQVLTEGVLIVLELDGTEYEYHGNGRDAPFYCSDPTPPAAD